MRCRPREGGDPYSLSVLFTKKITIIPVRFQMQWLWVPAFAGTTDVEIRQDTQ